MRNQFSSQNCDYLESLYIEIQWKEGTWVVFDITNAKYKKIKCSVCKEQEEN